MNNVKNYEEFRAKINESAAACWLKNSNEPFRVIYMVKEFFDVRIIPFKCALEIKLKLFDLLVKASIPKECEKELRKVDMREYLLDTEKIYHDLARWKKYGDYSPKNHSEKLCALKQAADADPKDYYKWLLGYFHDCASYEAADRELITIMVSAVEYLSKGL